MNDTMGARVRRARIDAGLTQRRLARRAHVSVRVIQRIELDRTDPTIGTLQALAAAVGLTLQALVPEREVACG